MCLWLFELAAGNPPTDHLVGPWEQKKEMTHHYTFITASHKTYWTRYLCEHCIILDRDTMLCYHLTNPEGYVCAYYEDVMQEYDVVETIDFESESDIEDYFNKQKESHPEGYDLVDNNCEDFANGFYKQAHSTQKLFWLSGAAVACALYCCLL